MQNHARLIQPRSQQLRTHGLTHTELYLGYSIGSNRLMCTSACETVWSNLVDYVGTWTTLTAYVEM